MTYWLNKFDAITREFRDSLASIPGYKLSIAPDGGWSIAQHVDHIIKVNESYFPAFDRILTGNYRQPGMAWCKPWVHFCGNMIYRAVKPTTSYKTKTFTVWEPGETVLTKNLWPRFEKHQARLIDYFNQLAPFVPEKVVLPSPANKYIIYTLEKVLMIIPAHELRHLNHALEIKKALASQE